MGLEVTKLIILGREINLTSAGTWVLPRIQNYSLMLNLKYKKNVH
jgi:hypothetical protein